MDSYADFAEFYDSLTDDVRYGDRCDHLLELIRRHGREPGLTLDLACGTGSLTLELKKRGVDVFGADASPEMLSIASQKAFEAELPVLFLNQKMQELELHGAVDTCLCTLDSINHITDEKTLQKAFERVGMFTKEHGLFIFDANTVYKHREVLGNQSYIIETEEVFCAWQNTLLGDDTVQIDLDFFAENPGGSYSRFSESFRERAYTAEKLTEMLENAGFSVKAVYGDMSFEPPREDEQRIIIVAEKNKKEDING